MKKIILMLISICLLNCSVTAQDKTLDDILEKYEGKEGISDIKVLLDEGINAKNKNGSTALMVASQYGHTEIVELLKEAGAK